MWDQRQNFVQVALHQTKGWTPRDRPEYPREPVPVIHGTAPSQHESNAVPSAERADEHQNPIDVGPEDFKAWCSYRA